MIKSIVAFSSIILVLASSAKASFVSQNMKTLLDTSHKGAHLSVYQTQDSPLFYQAAAVQAATGSAVMADFQKQVRARVDVDPYFLLKRQRVIFDQAGIKELLPRFDLVLQQDLVAMSFLEQIFFELHAEKMQKPLFQSFTEFGLNVLKGPRGDLILIFISNSEDATVPNSGIREKILKKYLAKGYKYKIHIHSHPFIFDNGGRDIGGTILPSGIDGFGDVPVYLKEKKNFKLENAWITNGFNTLRIQAADFDKY